MGWSSKNPKTGWFPVIQWVQETEENSHTASIEGIVEWLGLEWRCLTDPQDPEIGPAGSATATLNPKEILWVGLRKIPPLQLDSTIAQKTRVLVSHGYSKKTRSFSKSHTFLTIYYVRRCSGSTRFTPPKRQTWNLTMHLWKRRFLLDITFFRFYLTFFQGAWISGWWFQPSLKTTRC